MTSGRNIWLAGICAASVLAAGLRLGDIVPGWVFRTLCTLALGTIWLRLGQQVWHRLRQRQRPWFLFWNYALPVLVAIPTLASLSDDVVPVDQRFLAAAATGAVLACIYRLIYLKNKNMRKKIVAGNWKMNFDHLEATYFVQKLVWLLRDAHFDFKRCEVALFPSFTSLRSVQVLVEADKLHVAYGAQSVSVTTQGAFTGDVSADMIAHLGCSYVIVGHSERRKYHPEDDAKYRRSGTCRARRRHAADFVRRRKLRGTTSRH